MSEWTWKPTPYGSVLHDESGRIHGEVYHNHGGVWVATFPGGTIARYVSEETAQRAVKAAAENSTPQPKA